MSVHEIGAFALGAALGCLTQNLIRRDPNPGIADLAAIVAVISGAAVFKAVLGESETGWYLIGVGADSSYAGLLFYWDTGVRGRMVLRVSNLIVGVSRYFHFLIELVRERYSEGVRPKSR